VAQGVGPEFKSPVPKEKQKQQTLQTGTSRCSVGMQGTVTRQPGGGSGYRRTQGHIGVGAASVAVTFCLWLLSNNSSSCLFYLSFSQKFKSFPGPAGDRSALRWWPDPHTSHLLHRNLRKAHGFSFVEKQAVLLKTVPQAFVTLPQHSGPDPPQGRALFRLVYSAA
jgi:hypothetical protein